MRERDTLWFESEPLDLALSEDRFTLTSQLYLLIHYLLAFASWSWVLLVTEKVLINISFGSCCDLVSGTG